jgi:hypothetical protein
MSLTDLADARLFDECVDATTKAAYECPGNIYSRALAQAQATPLFQEPHLPTCDCGVA